MHPEYGEKDKLQSEVEKIKLEIQQLKKPFLAQPGNWIAIIGLIISVVLNFKQSSEIEETKEHAEVKLENAKLEYKIVDYETIKLQEKKEAAIVRLDSIANAYQTIRTDLYNLKALPREKWDSAINKIIYATDKADSLSNTTIRNFEASAPKKQTINDAELAEQKEEEGFEKLVNNDFEGAYAAFKASEDAYNGYRWSYELARILRREKDAANDEGKRKELFQTILDKCENGIPGKYKTKIKEKAR